MDRRTDAIYVNISFVYTGLLLINIVIVYGYLYFLIYIIGKQSP